MSAAILQGHYDPVIIRLYDGTYETSGITAVYPDASSFSLIGNGKSKTFIRLKNNASFGEAGGGMKFKSVIDFGSRTLNDYFNTDTFNVSDLSIDCNWLNQGTYATPNWTYGAKLMGIMAKCRSGVVERVTVYDFGGNEDLVSPIDTSGTEVFPLGLHTKDSSANSFVRISFCDVFNNNINPQIPNLMRGAYCTAIHVVTGTGRSTFGGQISNCNVYNLQRDPNYSADGIFQGPGGSIAYGTAGSEGVTFAQNNCWNVNSVFNLDTGHIRSIWITGNAYLDANYGINCGAQWYGVGAFSDVHIVNNNFTVRGPVAGRNQFTYTWAVRLGGGNSNTYISGNSYYNPWGSSGPIYGQEKMVSATGYAYDQVTIYHQSGWELWWMSN
ncbi:MAG: hypothetical protein HY735_18625 [Verrucomicrobia bacterium]|nr:hypothetical protein [Verrucomicrobiota bacterium]